MPFHGLSAAAPLSLPTLIFSPLTMGYIQSMLIPLVRWHAGQEAGIMWVTICAFPCTTWSPSDSRMAHSTSQSLPGVCVVTQATISQEHVPSSQSSDTKDESWFNH